MKSLQVLLFLSLVFLLCFSSTNICDANYTDFDYNNRFRFQQQMASQTSKSESADTFRSNNFIVGTIGLHTLFEGRAFGGITAHLGGGRETKGFGILGSYEGGNVDVLGYDATIHILNLSAAFSYRFGDSSILVAIGVTGGSISLDDYDEEESGSGFSSSFSYLYQPDNKFTFMLQGRRQGKGIMLLAGVGF